ncbi:MAG: DUF488 family protein [Clostridia bacterium]
MIYTSYYGNLRYLSRMQDYQLVAIANTAPVEGIARQKMFMPAWQLIQDFKTGHMTTEAWVEAYIKQLDALGFNCIQDYLEQLENNNQDTAFLCYERPDMPCHRHILAEYLRRHSFDVREADTYSNVPVWDVLPFYPD